jgi:peroxiredoxin
MWIRNLILISIFFYAGSCNKKNENFTLTSTDNKSFELTEIENNYASVFVFFDVECPLSQNYTSKINELSEKYSPNNINFYCVFPSQTAENPEVKKFKRKYNLEMSCLGDPEKSLTKYLEATVTPEAFLLNADKQVLYSGRIDNWASALGIKRQITTSHDLDDAINSFINNKKIEVKKTEAIGCLIE